MKAVWSGMGHALRYMKPFDALKVLSKLNQKGGIDCPGCAWPDPDDERKPMAEYCENGMKAIAEEATSKSIGARFFRQNALSDLSLLGDFELGKSGRITEPMLLEEGSDHYIPVDWDTAFTIIADELNKLDSPDEAIFYTSGRTGNEAAFLYQLFIRAYGTNNLPDCSNMCHESSGKGLSKTIGIGKGTVTLEDFEHTDLVLVIGQNPGTNHPRMLSALEKTKNNGGKIIAINPLPEAGLLHFVNPQSPTSVLTGGTTLTDLFMQVRINGDVAVLKAIMCKLLEKERRYPGAVFNWAFIEEHTTGFDAFLTALEQSDYQKCLEESGVSDEYIVEAVKMILSARKIIICWAMGLTQHHNAVDNIQEVVNLLLLKGSIGIKGGGVCPVRGHSNVQGDRTMGIWEMPPQWFLDSIERNFGFKPPQEHGHDVVAAINAMHEGSGKVFFAMGGNFLSATPDTEFTAEALFKTRLTVHVSTKLNRSHLIHGARALILPCLGRTDKDMQASGLQFVTVENSMGVVHTSQGNLEPPSKDLLSEVDIVCRLADKTLGDKIKIDWLAYRDNYDLIRESIERTIPGFDQYNERVRRPEGFYLPNGPREQKWGTPDGKAHFSVLPLPDLGLKADEFIMMTVRSHDQFNTTIYGMHDRYRGIHNERRVVFVNPVDIARFGLKPGQIVDISSEYNGKTRVAHNFRVISFDIAEKCVATYFPETNVLVPIEEFAHTSRTPISKSVKVRLKPSAAQE